MDSNKRCIEGGEGGGGKLISAAALIRVNTILSGITMVLSKFLTKTVD